MRADPPSGTPARDPLKPSLGPLADLLGFHLARAEVATNAAYERHVGKPHNLRKVEYSLLMLVLANGPLPPKTLARVLALSAPSLTMLLDRMQLRGLLHRERSQTDRRSQNVVLTPAGDTLARATAAAALPMEQELRHRLSSAEHAMLVELLAKLAQRPGAA
jgi:DNA-binding MarR family transcriptional regulator